VSGNPWDRHEDESDQAWGAFKEYRDMGPGVRSQAKVARKLGKSRGTVSSFASQHAWRVRVRSWDAEADAADQARDQVERGEMRRKMLEEHAGVGRRAWQLGIRVLLPDDDDAAIAKLGEMQPSTVLRLVQFGITAEAQSRALQQGRGLDPRDIARVADEMVKVALRFVPDEMQAAFLDELDALVEA
jgi:hypothetical protein